MGTEAEPETQFRTLPSNPTEFERAIAPYRIMVRPVVICVKKMTKVLPPKDELDADEHESLEMSYAAAMYQSGGNVDFRITAALATLGVAIPRVIKYLDEREEKEKEKKSLPTKTNETTAELIRLKNELEEMKRTTARAADKPLPAIRFEGT